VVGMVDVFDIHGDEIRMLEKEMGTIKGRLFFALCILSDVQEMISRDYNPQRVIREIDEVKQLIISVQQLIEEGR